jgi:Tat protein translocase TatB subunit
LFADLGIEKLLVLALIGLFVLGPERLPAALSWLSRTVGRLRSFADDAQRSLHRELGPDLDQLREPLHELRQPLQQLRGLTRPGGPAGLSLLTTPAQPSFTEPPGSSSAPLLDPHHRESSRA